MAKLYWEDFSAGQIIDCGRRHVSADEIKQFATEFDPQPMHLDEHAARATPAGGLIASGWHTCAILMRMIADGFLLESASMGAPGVDEVRWLAPVRPGDELTARGTVLATRTSRSRPELGLISMLYEVFNQSGTCVLTERCTQMLERRDVAAVAEAARA
ncbi:MAG: MaoC family dehydratase [Xanthobacteraceae bacterium]|nr:MaoC family dehydratase [Xanthobacteraceae bacterium]MBV9630278.1 MaoC family dehydratase [Xanthobacteraceae bacterium]